MEVYMNKEEVINISKSVFESVCHEIAKQRRLKSTLYKQKDSFLGTHEDGTNTINCYAKKHRGSTGRISDSMQIGYERMEGFYSFSGTTDIIRDKIIKINDPGFVFELLANNSELVINGLDFCFGKCINVWKLQSLRDKQISDNYISSTLEMIQKYQNLNKLSESSNLSEKSVNNHKKNIMGTDYYINLAA